MATIPPPGDDIKTSGLTLPAYVLMRPEGVFIHLSPPPQQDILKLFVERLFSNEARFAELDYARFIRLLYGTISEVTSNGTATEMRIAGNIVRFPPQRRNLYRGVNILDGGERAEYMFEPVFLELNAEEPAHAEQAGGDRTAANEAAPIARNTRDTELQPTRLDFDEFVADMWLKGVRFGIDAEAVRKVIDSGTAIRMNIARQLEPTDSKDAAIVEESDTLRQDNAPLILPNGKADLRRAKNRFPQVAKNTRLLRKIPRVLGEPGYRVTGAAIEPRLPEDIDLNKLAGEGTRIEQSEKGELLVAAMDGFLCLDEDSGKIHIATKIENKGGISAKATGDIKLAVDEFTEHGEVQEGRVVEGKHMTFRSDVFGTVVARDGNIQLEKNIGGGRAQSIGGNITVKGLAFNSTLEAWDGNITAGVAEGCVIIGKTVAIERAVNCEIVAEELQLGIAEGCAIAGKNIQIASSNLRKHRETIVTLLLPDITTIDKQIAEAKGNLVQIKNALQAKTRETLATQSDPGYAKYLAIAEKIQSGQIRLTAEQQVEWQRIVNQYAPIQKGSDSLMKKCLALEVEIERLSQARSTCGAGERCEIKEILGDTIVRKLDTNAGISVFRDLPARELKERLNLHGTPQERIFSKRNGSIEWHFQIPESSAA